MPPVNVDFAHATDIGTLTGTTPYTTTEDSEGGELWYQYTAVAGDNVIGVFGFGDLSNYQPILQVFLTDGGAPYLNLVATNRPAQFPVTAGTTYYLQFAPLDPPGVGNTTLTLRVQRFQGVTAPAGSLLINDDGPGFPAAVISATDGTVLQFLPDVAGGPGERLDVLHATGQALVADGVAHTCHLYDSSLAETAVVAFNAEDGAISTNHVDRFYVGNPAVPAFGPAQIRTVVASDGSLGSTWALDTAGLQAATPNLAETVLYYNSVTTHSKIKQWDLINDVALSDLVADVATYRLVPNLVVLSDGTLVAGYWKSSTTQAAFLRHYAADGSTLHTYAVTPTLDRICPGLDDTTSVWAWQQLVTGGTSGPLNGISRFTEIQISDGTILHTFDQPHFSFGAYQAPATATPLAYFGHAQSCHVAVLSVALTAPAPPPISGTLDLTAPGPSSSSLPDGAVTLTGYVLPPRHPDAFCGNRS